MRLKQLFCILSTGLVLLSSCQMVGQKQGISPDQIETFEEEPPVAKPKLPRSTTTTPIQKVGPQSSVDALPVYQGGGRKVSSVNVSGKYVALTFDDGPHPTYTPKILDILKKYNAKATFFVQGSRVKMYPSIVARTIAEGSEVGNHSWDHPSLTKLSASGVKSQLSRTNEVIQTASPAYRIRVMRPPYGAVDTNLVNFMAHDYGMSTIMWSIDTNDWRKPGVQTVINRAVNPARPGSIILMHDIHGSSFQAVEGVVSGLIARGFTLVTVSQLMAMQHSAPAAAPAVAPAVAPAAAPAVAPAVAPVAETATSIAPVPAVEAAPVVTPTPFAPLPAL